MNYQPVYHISISILIAEEIQKFIIKSNMALGDSLPPLRELAHRFGVSIPSVRKAMSLLADYEIVTIKKNSCTLVNSIRDIDFTQMHLT